MKSAARRVAGIETEYAVFGTQWGEPLDARRAAQILMERAECDLLHVSGDHGDLFLTNGARFYLDQGAHPEMSTPECAHPKDVVRYTLAGERILLDLTTRLAGAADAPADIGVYRLGVDHSGAHATWGCHESYQYRGSPDRMWTHVIPHLVTRLVYTGAGGFDPSAAGPEFVVSPRVTMMEEVISSSSTYGRGIVHTRDESLAKEHHRLHLLCGDSLCSQRAAWLKVGTTALVVALIDAGKLEIQALELESPLQAMHAFTADPSCRAEASLRAGGRASALHIQRRLLEQAESHLGQAFMPAWAAETCRAWREVLDALAADPLSLAGTLDWVMKWSLFRRHAEGRGFSWRTVESWARYLRSRRTLRGQRPPSPPPRPGSNLVNRHGPRGWGRVRRERTPDGEPGAAPARRRAPPWRSLEALAAMRSGRRSAAARSDDPSSVATTTGQERLSRFLSLKNELLELDLRFGQLGERGLFEALDRAGVLDHRVEGIDDVEAAMEHGPRDTRARLRGEIVRRFANHEGVTCSWSRVVDRDGRRLLDLGDPFESIERWEELPEPVRESLLW